MKNGRIARGTARKILLWAAAGCFALSLCALCLCLAACTDGTDGGDDPPAAAVTFSAAYEDGALTFRWQCEGAESFTVYAEGEEGTYRAVGETTDGVYRGADPAVRYRAAAVADGEEFALSEPFSYAYDAFGSAAVRVFTEADDAAAIQSYFDGLYAATEKTEFSADRHAVLFLPGDYADVTVKIGYYTSVSGLGTRPGDVYVGGLQTLSRTDTGHALINFWRTAENFTVGRNATWSVSQATSLRRMEFRGDLLLCDNGASSGGFIADSTVLGTVNPASQQQWLARNCWIANWSHVLMNMAFAGVQAPQGGIPADDWEHGTHSTVLSSVASMREKPYLVFDESRGYGVMVPALRQNAAGVSWGNGASGEFLPLTEFYIANAGTDTAESLNAALAAGKNLLFTPGFYSLSAPLQVTRADTVVLGMGLATLAIGEGNADACMHVADADGVSVAGLLFDAGASSENLLVVGEEGASSSHASDPLLLSDVFFRAGGDTTEKTAVESCLVIHASDVIGDNFWVWRADHGLDPDDPEGHGWDTVGWDFNRAENGVTVNGDNVTVYGLMVEHFQGYQTVWNGENGFVFFYQSETPYDAPSQADWMSKWKGVSYNGCASYKIGDGVQKHTARALGVYYVNTMCDQSAPTCDNVKICDHAVECPETPGIEIAHLTVKRFHGHTESHIAFAINAHGQTGATGETDFITTVGLF